jgi:hypothetical protein
VCKLAVFQVYTIGDVVEMDCIIWMVSEQGTNTLQMERDKYCPK